MDDINTSAQIAAVAELIADASRASMLEALLGKEALPAGELAYRAGVSPQTASAHLAKLVAGGLLTQTIHGRHRYYALAGVEVAHALEVLATLAPPMVARSLRQSITTDQLRYARTCYDHLAGKVGVALTEALLDAQTLAPSDDGGYILTDHGSRLFTAFGVDLAPLRRQRRAFARPCLDWSERRHHLAGALGAALTEQLLRVGWLARIPGGRAVRVTDAGQAGFLQEFGVRV